MWVRKTCLYTQTIWASSCTKDERGDVDRRAYLDWTVQAKKNSRGHILLNLGSGLLRYPLNGLGREWGSFLSVRVIFLWSKAKFLLVKWYTLVTTIDEGNKKMVLTPVQSGQCQVLVYLGLKWIAPGHLGQISSRYFAKSKWKLKIWQGGPGSGC